MFIGVVGIDVIRGIIIFNEFIGVICVMVVVVSKVVIVVSLKKLMYKMFNLELSWKNIFVLIIDEGISE